jgi:hypothetical protein
MTDIVSDELTVLLDLQGCLDQKTMFAIPV